MVKVEKISQSITPFGGISFVHDIFERSGMRKLIDKELGTRNSTFGYTYGTLLGTWFDLFLCGGDCAEDMEEHLYDTLSAIPGNRVCKADTLLRCLKELSVENTPFTSDSGNTYQFNINEKLNSLMIKSLLLTGQLEKGKSCDFDYDNQIIEHEKYDAKRTYKKNTGYFPGAAAIGDRMFYIENRDGNAGVKTGQAETLQRAYRLLSANGLKVRRSRMDAGSYSKEIIEVAAAHSELFYIRANRCASLTERIRQIETWETVEINFKEYQVASLQFTQFFEDRNYRLTVMREKSDNPQADLFTGDNFIYRSILTNDHESSEKEVIEYYNQRGASEKNFDTMNNDFGWKHLPCSDMPYNTVYMIITAMIKNFYLYILPKIAEAFKNISPATRLKRFIFRFICVAGRWVYQNRGWKLRLYTDRPYERLVA
ncbi:MAG: IS1380 family transposase [Tannerella sp.]|jgi:hypothetical protein|nr:IS1380 family transposase [Tannerella sp.]